jgi:hypothetical protein
LPSQPFVSPRSLGTGVVASYLACGSIDEALSAFEHVIPSPAIWWNQRGPPWPCNRNILPHAACWN